MHFLSTMTIASVFIALAAPLSARADAGLAQLTKDAQARAKDFRAVMNERDKEDNSREIAGYKWREKLDEKSAEQEKFRREYVEKRNAQAPDDLVRVQMEKQDDERMKKQEAERDQQRKLYVQKRNEVRSVMERDGHIDEKREYGL